MRAWCFETVENGLILSDVPDPYPGEGEVLIDVLAAGLCHTDVSVIEGHLQPKTTPMILGHEICGTIAELGANVTGWSVGDRVALIAGTEGAGNSRDGGYAPQVVSEARLLIAVPDGVDDAVAAVATDAGLTAYHAVHAQGEVTAGLKVGIIGLGGLGMLGARLAVVAGAEVYAAEIREALFPIAAEQGVVTCANSITEFADKNLDVIIDFAGMNTTNDAFKTVRAGGRVVQVGVGRTETTIDLLEVLYKQLEYRGSIVGTPEDLTGFLSLVAEGEVAPNIERIRLDQIGDGIQRLARGEVSGRLVAVPTSRPMSNAEPHG